MKNKFLLSTIAVFTVLTSLSAQPHVISNEKCTSEISFTSNISIEDSKIVNAPPKSDEAIYPTKYLIEHFTASTCPPCQPMNYWMNPMYREKHAAGKLIYIKYPMNWPGAGDPYYVAADGNPRRIFYNVTGVPSVYGNGGALSTAGFQYWHEVVENWGARIDAFEGTLSAYDIQLEYANIPNDGSKIINISYTIIPNTTAQVTIQTVVFQDRTTGNIGTNGETEFFHTVMKMFPNGNGNVQSFVKGVPFTVTYQHDMNTTFMENISNLKLVVFLQNQSTRAILGAAERTISNRPFVVAPEITFEHESDSALVSITSSIDGGVIYYSLDGTTPTTGSSAYTEPFWVYKNTTVRAMVVDGEWTSMPTTTNVTFTVATPQITFVEIENGKEVSITCATAGATIYYTTNGQAPTITDATIYTEPFTIDITTRIRAVAVKEGWTNSPGADVNVPVTTSNRDMISGSSLKIYPNPADEYVNIEYPGIAKLSLFSANGVLVYEGTMNGHTRLSLADYPSGTYVLRVVSDEGSVTERIIKR
jgi:hypothetical protein